MAEMGAKMEQARLMEKHGHLSIQSLFSTTMGQTLLLIALVLFFLVLIAGVLMISSSMNSSVAQRTKFFGMMRCIGMSRRQIICFVRLEALNWCKTGVPIGVILGMITTWGLSAGLRFFVGEEFSHMPLFGISILGIFSGTLVGIITVLLAASSPARRAAKVSPMAAVSGNLTNDNIGRVSNGRLFKIETLLGCHHAISVKKNMILMTGSFALSIILFLSFSVFIEFIGYLIPQLSNASDIDISVKDTQDLIDKRLLDVISEIDGVERVFGRRSAFNIPAKFTKGRVSQESMDMISYDKFDLDCLTKDKQLKKGSDISKVYGNSNYVLATWDKDSSLAVGDKVRVDNEELIIAGLLKYDPFNSDGTTKGKITIITSSPTFIRLTQSNDYSLLMIQTTKDIRDKDVKAIREAVGEKYRVNDKRDQHTSGIYMAFLFFVYGFLSIISLVTILNIMNTISMSVSARIRQYGAMRAIGMDDRQLSKMIASEAFTYAISGSLVGCSFGLLLSKFFYDRLITSHFHYAVWHVPLIPMMIIFSVVFVAVAASVYLPTRRIGKMAITDTINEL